MCPVVEEEESLKDVDIRDDYTDTDCSLPRLRPSPKKRSRLEGNAAGRASMAQLVVNQDVTPKGRSAVGGGRSRSLNPAPTRRGAAARRLTGTRSVADIQADHAAAEMDTVVKKAVAGIVQSIRIKAIEMIEQELLPTVEAMAEAGIREALATGTSDGRRTRSSSLDIVVESPTSQRKD
ncbi:hypothetical protein Pmar_PMAR019204 [Perkinsus marinus ATCC 50983]|uniref:Uncharacterized protein n=1 Tax=Perkinsus marinus (strain ATCC 50983 / TXsc) TaxID=423536 RepID=C5KU56_PERM5|nr:hypothetical protein Pmar_PMAR019204 [Perkinsus marinus ATCC 50983]EER12098.1 hypothetical protein Pmar_PMAR019204 [Perkinsus marinus ATCC 50983]|eukprot:XP_002780303.1 hypothetical protein Pmar_PMAR019204 [Perkinsus marinus ATCC 50983]